MPVFACCTHRSPGLDRVELRSIACLLLTPVHWYHAFTAPLGTTAERPRPTLLEFPGQKGSDQPRVYQFWRIHVAGSVKADSVKNGEA